MRHLCLTMIVKNESKCIEKCLESVSKYIDYWVICDTGSTDNTRDIVKNFFRKKNIPGKLYEDEWINFGHNRTLSLQRAKDKSQYSFVMDADDILEGELYIPPGDYTNFSINIHYNNLNYSRKQIFNNKLNWKYIGVIHEYPEFANSNVKMKMLTLQDCMIQASTTGSRNDNFFEKYNNDKQLLLEGIKNEPKNSRYYFYLANTCYDLCEYTDCILYYSTRIEMGGFEEEIYYSKYRMAMAYMNLFDFSKAKPYFLEAFYSRPTRLEALYEIVKYYRVHSPAEGYNYGLLGYYSCMNIPDDILFINKSIHKFSFLDEFAVCSYYANNHKLAIELNNKILDSYNSTTSSFTIDIKRIKKNISLSISKLVIH